MNLNAAMHCKESCFEPGVCKVEKVIRLSDDEYCNFAGNMLAYHDFIRENRDLMRRTADGCWHCLLVVGESLPDGILVEAEGYEYARYTALVPNAKELLLAQRIPQEMREYLARLPAVADGIVAKRNPELDIFDLETMCGVELSENSFALLTLRDELLQRPEISAIDFEDEFMIIGFCEQTLENTSQAGEMEMNR